jgi:hypothetical protein
MSLITLYLSGTYHNSHVGINAHKMGRANSTFQTQSRYGNTTVKM